MARDPASSASGRNNEFLQRAYTLSGPDQTKDLYDAWATSYDNDLKAEDYASPQRCVDAVLENLRLQDATTDQIKILDAGCGTGLVGECFAHSVIPSNRFVIDGVDLVQSMLEVARVKGVYRGLEAADLNKPLEKEDGSYDVITCIGTLTKGHVGPHVFKDFARLASKGGLIVAGVHDDIFESNGYKREVDALGADGIVEVISYNEFGMLQDSTEGGRMVVLRKV